MGKPNVYLCPQCGASVRLLQMRCPYCESYLMWPDNLRKDVNTVTLYAEGHAVECVVLDE